MNITPTQLEAIRDNDPDFFDEEYTDSQKQDFLYKSIALGKLDVIKHFVEQGVKVTNGRCIWELAEKNKKVKILQYLEGAGIDIMPDGGMPFLRACVANKPENAAYLAPKLEYDCSGMYLTLNIVALRDKFDEQKASLNKFEAVLNIILEKSSANTLNKVLNIKNHSPNSNANSLYISNLFLKMDKSIEEKSEVLNNAVQYGKFDIIKLYMESGIEITRNVGLLGLSKSPSVEILEYLESKQVDLTIDGHALLLQSLKDKNAVVAEFLAPKVKSDSDSVLEAVKLTVLNFEPINHPELFQILLKNISSTQLEDILTNVTDANKKTSVFNSYLSTQLGDIDRPKKTIKI
jgi:hypothetical protein